MRILISSLSCNPAVGSEALVGFKYVEALARRHEVMVLASPPSQTPAGVTLLACDAGPCSFNEVEAMPLLRFPFDWVHRVTPSAIQVPTWAGRLVRPLVIGPLIAADRPAPAFSPLLERPVSRPKRPRWHPMRLAARFCRMAVDRVGRRHAHL